MDIEHQLRSGLELEKGEKLVNNVWEAKQKFRQVIVKETTNMKEALAEIKAYGQKDHGQNILRLYDYSIQPGKVVQFVLEKAQCSLTEFIDKCWGKLLMATMVKFTAKLFCNETYRNNQ
jgi:hypothetical protein